MTNFLSSNNGILGHKGDNIEAFKASMGLTNNTSIQKFNKNKDKPVSNLDYIDSTSVLDTFVLLDVEVNGAGSFNYYINNKDEKEKEPGFLAKIISSFTQ